MKKGKVAFAYLLAGMLFLGYVGILWWARTPEVSDLYRMYYIDQELLIWPGSESFLESQFGVWESLGSLETNEPEAKRMGLGWSDQEKNGRWTDGKSASFWYRIPEKERNASFHFSCQVTDSITAKEVQIYAGDCWVGEIPPQHTGDFVFEIPAGCVNTEGFLQIILEVEEPVVPDFLGDQRELGVMVSRIRLELNGGSEYV